MINSGTGNKVTNDDFLQVLLALKENIMKATGVAEVCQAVNVSDGVYSCKTISSGTNVECYPLQGLEVNIDDVVVVLFTDTDFRANLKRIKNGKETQAVKEGTLHAKDCGIIIGILYRGEEQ